MPQSDPMMPRAVLMWPRVTAFGQFVGRQGVSLRAGGLRWGWRWLKGRRGLGRCSLRREARNQAGEQQGKAEHQQIFVA